MKIGYFHCFSGASGDMILGALVDAGLSAELLLSRLACLPLKRYEFSFKKEKRGVISGTHVDIRISESAEIKTRKLESILDIIDRSALEPELKKWGNAIFMRLARAEAKVHGTSPDNLTFHELGGIDTILDIMGAVIGFSEMGLEKIYCSALPSGGGWAHSEHGKIPIPAPSILELLAEAKAPLYVTSVQEEILTPTGAAILSELAIFSKPHLTIEKIGYGIGTKILKEQPNALALWIGQEDTEEQEVVVLEANIDDMNPEIYSYVTEVLMERGALDVWLTPIQMKKNRPAITLSVLAKMEQMEEMTNIIFRETTTLGLRLRNVERRVAERRTQKFQSSLGKVRLKIKNWKGRNYPPHPEYEDCRRLAEKHGIPLQEVYARVSAEYSDPGKGNKI